MSTSSVPLAVTPWLRSHSRRVGIDFHPEANFVVAPSLEIERGAQDVEWTVSWVGARRVTRGCNLGVFRVTWRSGLSSPSNYRYGFSVFYDPSSHSGFWCHWCIPSRSLLVPSSCFYDSHYPAVLHIRTRTSKEAVLIAWMPVELHVDFHLS